MEIQNPECKKYAKIFETKKMVFYIQNNTLKTSFELCGKTSFLDFLIAIQK